MTKGKDGCDDSCNGCQPPAQSSAAVTSDPTSTAEAPSSTPDPTSTTPEPTPTPTEDPNKPTNLKCYGEGTANSLISFDESASTDPISKFCNDWIGDYTYEVDHASMAQLSQVPQPLLRGICGVAWPHSLATANSCELLSQLAARTNSCELLSQ
jgi:hypothetical protein